MSNQNNKKCAVIEPVNDINSSSDNNNEVDPCSICLDPLYVDAEGISIADDKALVGRIDPCLHVYHHWCIKSWSKLSNTCPKCRGKFEQFDVVKLYPDPKRNGKIYSTRIIPFDTCCDTRFNIRPDTTYNTNYELTHPRSLEMYRRELELLELQSLERLRRGRELENQDIRQQI